MSKAKLLLFISLLITSFLFLSLSSAPVHASVLDDFVNGVKNTVQGGVDGVKNLFNKDAKSKELTIDTDISLAPGGDISSNNQIDAGDIIRFTYTITNTTDKSYTYATLKTNIDRKQLNFVHNVYGVTGLTDDGNTIMFRNLRINPQEQHIISFDARINYYQEDRGIASEPEFITFENNSIVKAAKKDVKAKKLTKEEVRARLNKNGIIFNREQE